MASYHRILYGYVGSDSYEIFFDYDARDEPFDDQWLVKKNGATLVKGSATRITPASPFRNEGYTYHNNTTEYYFEFRNTWPYANKLSREYKNEDVVDDLEGTAIAGAAASSSTASDGAVTFYASGTYAPFYVDVLGKSYPISTAVSDNNSQWDYETTISTFRSGDHPYTIRDNKRHKRNGSVKVEELDKTAAATYGQKYYYRFTDLEGNTYRVEIHERDFADSATELTNSGGTPITIRTNGQGSELHDIHVLETEATIEIISETFRQWQDIAESDDTKYLIKFHDNQAGSSLVWQGFLTPQTFSESYASPSYVSTFSAHDRVGDLNEHDFINRVWVEDTYFNKYFREDYVPETKKGSYKETKITGKYNQLYLVHICLRNLKMPFLGYRVACNLFEDSHDATATDTPLIQTYIDAETYYQKDNPMTCKEVIDHILKPYGAMLVFWAGYWYIIRKEEMEGTSIAYVQYDDDPANWGSPTNSTWSPRINFGANTDSTRYRYQSGTTLSYSPSYRNIVLRLKYDAIENGFGGSEDDAEWKGWGLHIGNENDGNEILDVTSKKDLNANSKRQWTVGIPRENTNTYWYKSGDIEVNASDALNVEFNLKTGINGYGSTITTTTNTITDNNNSRIPYYSLFWVLKVGDYWYSRQGLWQTNEVINQEWVETLGSEYTFKNEIAAPVLTTTDTTYQLTIYAPSIFQSNLSAATKAALKTAIKNYVDVSDLSSGVRIVGKVLESNNDITLYYMELAETDERFEESVIVNGLSELDLLEQTMRAFKPNTGFDNANPKYWMVRATYKYDHSRWVNAFPSSAGGRTVSVLSGVKIEQLPSGQTPPEEEVIEFVANEYNSIDVDIELYHFDLSGKVSGDQYIYRNFLRLSDNTQTDSWNYNSGNPNTIQKKLGEYYAKKYGKSRAKLSGSMYSDVMMTPLRTLYDDGDSNMVLFLKGLEMNFRMNMYSGEVEEIANDNTPAIADWYGPDWLAADWFGGTGEVVVSTLLTGIVAYYNFDEASGNLLDQVNSYDGTVSGAIQGGSDYTFDGVNDLVSVDSLVTPLASLTTGTIAGRIKIPDNTATGDAIFTLGDTNAQTDFRINLGNPTKLQLFIRQSGTIINQIVTSSNPFVNNTYLTFAICQSGSGVTIYINGSSVAITQVGGTASKWFNDLTGLDNARIACLNTNSLGNVTFLEGSISKLGVWNRSLSASEITEWHNGGSVKAYPFT